MSSLKPLIAMICVRIRELSTEIEDLHNKLETYGSNNPEGIERTKVSLNVQSKLREQREWMLNLEDFLEEEK